MVGYVGRSDPTHVQAAAMEPAELAKIIFSRVQEVEPDNVSKIVGCILLREPDEDELVHLAYATDAALRNTIYEAKGTLAAIYARFSASPVHHYHQPNGVGYQQVCSHPAGLRHFSPAVQYWPPDSPPPAEKEYAFVDAAAAEPHYGLRGGRHGALGDGALGGGGGGYYSAAGFPPATGRRSNGVSSRRPCHYFFKGICKNGQNCHYSHHQVYTDGFAVDHHIHGGATPGSLESLEIEITELLHSRRGQPVSIASLPTLYGEKYGKGLQADGYLTESQRHGKAGFSLTKLLSRLNKIRVIERPHGQHSVVLAEDAAKYSDCRSDRGGEIPASSHQIYLTFPSDSNFTEDDVANYFGQYGPVRDVRIPCQDHRMFGFVSFQNPETVTALLMRRNPHFICGSRVLAKAYREKTKCINERTNNKSTTHCYPPRWIETDPEFYPDQYDSPRLERRQLARDRQQLLELERRHLAGLRVVEPQCAAYFDCSIGDVAPFNSHSQSQSQSAGSKEVGRTMDPLSTADQLDDIVSTSQSQAPPIQANNNYDDQESNQIELLPESPFASSAPTGNGI
ncbi:unnamed protein product [Triticum turgidum subsp. durum]|uniref:Uncharacterized protein n=1 Tax=Triticum turgidum subsp. durum TaxID=4567 RepID=A0A9R0X7E6_TRITD|nr:unnamed protein product [Triticum turgidum subsp. durum]